MAQKGKSKWRTHGTLQSIEISYSKFSHGCIMRVEHGPRVPLTAKFTTFIWENEGGFVHILENHSKCLMFLTLSFRTLSKLTIKEMDDWGSFSGLLTAFQKCYKQFCNCLLINLCCFPLGNVSHLWSWVHVSCQRRGLCLLRTKEEAEGWVAVGPLLVPSGDGSGAHRVLVQGYSWVEAALSRALRPAPYLHYSD